MAKGFVAFFFSWGLAIAADVVLPVGAVQMWPFLSTNQEKRGFI